MNKVIYSFLASLWLVSGLSAAPASPEAGSITVHGSHAGDSFTFSPTQAQSHYIGEFVRWARDDIGTLPRRDAVLAVGSSSIRMWRSIHDDLAPLEIIHRGFGGSGMANVVKMIDFFQRYEAGTVLVYQGDNDLAGDQSSVDAYLNLCERFISQMREIRPDVEIHFIATKPSPSRRNASGRFSEANARIKKICDSDPQLHFIDIYTLMLDADGQPRAELFIQDRLHMNEAGYEIWTEQVRKSFQLDN